MQVYLPELNEVYRRYADNIMEKMGYAKRVYSGLYQMNPGARTSWKYLKHHNEGFVQYGYGAQGKRLYAWMQHLNIRISEIWDKAAQQMKAENVKLMEPHFNLGNDVKVLLAIENILTALSVRGWLREHGIETDMMYQEINNALNYGMFEKYLPFLIEDYLE